MNPIIPEEISKTNPDGSVSLDEDKLVLEVIKRTAEEAGRIEARHQWIGRDEDDNQGKPVKGFWASMMEQIENSGNDPFPIRGLPKR